MRFWLRNLFFWILKTSGIFYKTPSNLNYWWNFGFLALCFLLLQIVTGIFLAMFYNPSILLAYSSIMVINNEVYFGWFIRSLHSNGASFFFAIVYIHMARGLYYGSFAHPREFLWASGVLIWVLMIITAFLGYILPWGQMSFWGAMVITSLLGSLPLIGNDVAYLLWGGYSIGDATLHRFYSLHFALPFAILILSIIHLSFLHESGSNNPLGIVCRDDTIPFSPYYILKDTFTLVLTFILLLFIIFFVPDLLGHPDNYEKANFLITPAHIVPEWYFLPLYAVLRSVTSKLLGIFLLILLIFTFMFFPFYIPIQIIKSCLFKPFNASFFWAFVFVWLLLSWLGGLPVMQPYLFFGLFFTFAYFFF
jgi:quinol-cytochrome oxidoreductase complex cytochrome b subunit